MATYVEDEETSKLIEQYAAKQGKTKTGALRDLLRRELNIPAQKSADQRMKELLAYVSSHSTEQSPIAQNDIESVYGYLDAD
jgi:hypothetical protein